MLKYEEIKSNLIKKPKKWLVTGVSGFIGSNILETLLNLNQEVVGLDNFATSKITNLNQVENNVSKEQWNRFRFFEGDIRDLATCLKVCTNIDYVLHQAALGSVPRSILEPLTSHDVNVTGTLNVFLAARDAKVRRVVYAASSASYGDHVDLPKIENRIGRPLSPYGLTKLVNELYADIMNQCYGLETIGLRYFNVFGKRQDPNGIYAAVIPKWIRSMLSNQPIEIFGTGETSRDFCYVENVVQANLLAATVESGDSVNQVYNVAVGDSTTLNQLYGLIKSHLLATCSYLKDSYPVYREFRQGDILHSLADISKAKKNLGYAPQYTVKEGLETSLEWYKTNV